MRNILIFVAYFILFHSITFANSSDESIQESSTSRGLRGTAVISQTNEEINYVRDLKHKKNHKKKHKKKTKNPTTGEEQIPTESPTNKPTKFGETHKPTKAPRTPEPTDFPTAYPTDAPTYNPTLKPTKSPSKDPTEKPTTLFPTKSPTNFPTTIKPTMSPQTRSPTMKPTVPPTHSPTMSPTEQRPNIIIIMGDDIGYYDLGAHGNPYVQTPYINQLRESSIRFENFHMNPTCAPSRAGLYTGRFASRGGVWHTIESRNVLYESEITMSQVFKQHGWSTALIGKWHLGDNYPYRAQDRGFDFTYTVRGGGIAQSPDYWANSNFNTVFYRNGILEKTTGFCTDTLFNEAINFISKAQQPFFLMMPTNAAHAPQNAPPEDEALYKAVPKAAQFYGMITNLDRNIGRLDTALEKLGLKQNTIFIVTSDNGSACGPDRCTFNGGDTGFKSSLFEGGHRVFMFFRWPKKGLVSNVVNQLTANIDIMPTLLDLSLINYVPADTNKFDGVSLAPLLFKIRDGKNLQTTPGKETKSPTSNIEEVLTNRIMIIEDQRVKIPEKYKNTVITKNTWRYIPPKLYNLAKDPKQTNDVSRGNPDIVKELDDYYSKFWDEMATVRSQCASFILGEEENPANFNPMDWFVSPPPPWSQDMIINELGFQEGAWNVKVRKPGMFRITARKYPEESLKAINSGKSQFRAAHFTAPNGVTKKVPIAGRLREVVFDDVYLEAGEFKLSVQFIPTEPSGLAMNAYYVTVAKYPLPTKNPTFKPTHLPTTARPTAPTQADQNYNITTYSPTSSSNITHRLG